MKKLLFVICASALILSGCGAGKKDMTETKANAPEAAKTTFKQAVIKTNLGDITVELFSNESPKTVANFAKLAGQGFYDGTRFHRVIKDFMIQGGDPNSKNNNKAMWGFGGPGYVFADEFNQQKLVKGSLAMANSGKDTNGSQFFIVTADATPWLDGKHTNFGKVIKGLDIVEKIGLTPTDGADHPLTDVIVEKIIVE